MDQIAIVLNQRISDDAFHGPRLFMYNHFLEMEITSYDFDKIDT